MMSSKTRNKSQSAYQLRVVKGTANFTGKVLWDTQKIASAQSVFVEYAGPKLESGATYYWQVRAWDEKENLPDGVPLPPGRWDFSIQSKNLKPSG